MSRKQKRKLTQILVAAGLLAVAWLCERLVVPEGAMLLRLALYLGPYGVVGWDVLKKAGLGLVRGRLFDEAFLMAVATLGALSVGFLPEGEPAFAEAVFVMLFYQVGEWFQSLALGRSRRSIASLMALRPDVAHWQTPEGLRDVDPEEVPVDALVVVRPGERLPLDGLVIEGESTLDTVALTGESEPRPVGPGSAVASGCVNGAGLLTVRVSAPYEASTVARILDLVENAATNKSRSEAFLTRFARWYTPSVVGAALVLAVALPLLTGGGWATWLARALSFLVVSCPCALVISVPLAFFGGIGGAGRRGILIKGSQYVEALCRAKTVVFDKTGTLTEGVFEVTAVHPSRWGAEELLRLAAAAERSSTHPVARSLCRAWPGETHEAHEVREAPGMGLCAVIEGKTVCIGNEALMASLGVEARPCHHAGTIIHVAIEGEYAGHIVISDRIKEASHGLTEALKARGVRRTVMLTGDRAAVAQEVAAALGVDEWHAEMLPADKVARVEAVIAQSEGDVVFVGDGINDAPVLMRADVGVAMGALGADAAIEAADVVLMDDDPRKLVTALAVARKTMRVVRENVFGALGVKIAVLGLSALGLTGMWLAVFADVGVLILAILNALRAGRVKG